MMRRFFPRKRRGDFKISQRGGKSIFAPLAPFAQKIPEGSDGAKLQRSGAAVSPRVAAQFAFAGSEEKTLAEQIRAALCVEPGKQAVAQPAPYHLHADVGTVDDGGNARRPAVALRPPAVQFRFQRRVGGDADLRQFGQTLQLDGRGADDVIVRIGVERQTFFPPIERSAHDGHVDFTRAQAARLSGAVSGDDVDVRAAAAGGEFFENPRQAGAEKIIPDSTKLINQI